MSTVRQDILQAALAITKGPRQDDYGSPDVNIGERTALMWDAYLQTRNEQPISGTDVCNLMILLKIARLMHSPGHYDSWMDIIGYAAAGWELSDVPVDSGAYDSRSPHVVKIS